MKEKKHWSRHTVFAHKVNEKIAEANMAPKEEVAEAHRPAHFALHGWAWDAPSDIIGSRHYPWQTWDQVATEGTAADWKPQHAQAAIECQMQVVQEPRYVSPECIEEWLEGMRKI